MKSRRSQNQITARIASHMPRLIAPSSTRPPAIGPTYVFSRVSVVRCRVWISKILARFGSSERSIANCSSEKPPGAHVENVMAFHEPSENGSGSPRYSVTPSARSSARIGNSRGCGGPSSRTRKDAAAVNGRHGAVLHDLPIHLPAALGDRTQTGHCPHLGSNLDPANASIL